MQKAYSRINWENYPSDRTPLNETNLNKLDVGVNELDNRVISLDSTKLDKTVASHLIKNFELDRETGVITITYLSGATATIDTMLEKVAVNFDYDQTSQKFIITLDDGTVKEINLSSLITQYEFKSTDTVAFLVDSNGNVSAIVKDGSIQERHLRSDYLADIMVESAKAEASAVASDASAIASENSVVKAESWAIGGTNTRIDEDTDNAKYYSEQSKASSETSKAYLDKVEQAGNEALDKINNAVDVNTPNFTVDLSTGRLMYESTRFVFDVNEETGHLEWGLTV